MLHAMMCPQCNAPLPPHNQFSKSVVCAYCGATVQLREGLVSAAMFKDAYRAWNSPVSHQIASWISVGDSHWALGRQIAYGAISDVYAARRARWPTELVIIKMLRNSRDTVRFDNEWEVLQTLHNSRTPGSDSFSMRLPQPVMRGTVNGGTRVNIFRWSSGFYHTLDEIIRVFPHGIDPQASIWVWRRILEILSFIHATGLTHGAVLPPHLLSQENDHGIRLVGYSVAGRIGDKLSVIEPGYESFYPKPASSTIELSPALDLAMTARCIIAILGGDPEKVFIPAAVPAPLASLLRTVALYNSSAKSAWALREELGALADQVFGPPRFLPIVIPS